MPVSLIDGHIDEQKKICEKCKNFDSKVLGCLYMDADCINGEMYEPFTNYDRIRNMSVEEMANLLISIYESMDLTEVFIEGKPFRNHTQLIEWLESEVED